MGIFGLKMVSFFENRAWLNLDALGVPEAFVYSIRILEAPGVFLVRRWHRC